MKEVILIGHELCQNYEEIKELIQRVCVRFEYTFNKLDYELDKQEISDLLGEYSLNSLPAVVTLNLTEEPPAMRIKVDGFEAKPLVSFLKDVDY